MSATGPILVIENDEEDRELLESAFKASHITNKIIFFEDGSEALSFLKSEKENPFLIIADIKLPRMDGIELRSRINGDVMLRKKSIPFVFLSELAESVDVSLAYELGVQGFFKKPNSLDELQTMLTLICSYWRLCVEPNQTLHRS